MTLRHDQIRESLEKVEVRIQNAAHLSGRARSDVTLIVVTKNHPASDVAILRELGANDFGENRESEGREKSSLMLGRWHFQGQIQSNKISGIVQWADVIHSLDDAKHLAKLESSMPTGKILTIFLQVSLDLQDSRANRGGSSPEDLDRLAELAIASPNMQLAGIMAVAPLHENPHDAFARLAQIHSDFRYKFPSAPFLSAGMSDDFEEAIAHGATHIRIGTSILGVRTPER